MYQTRFWFAPWTPYSPCTPITSRTPRPRPSVWPARPVPTRSPALLPASPVCGARRTVVPMKPALQMLEEIGDVSRVPEFIARAKDKNDSFKLMGFGHRVYKNFDPRATLMRKRLQRSADRTGSRKRPSVQAGHGTRAHRPGRSVLRREESSTRTSTSTRASSRRRSAFRPKCSPASLRWPVRLAG